MNNRFSRALAVCLLGTVVAGIAAPASAAPTGWTPWNAWGDAEQAGAPMLPHEVAKQDVYAGQLSVSVSAEGRAELQRLGLPADFFERAITRNNAVAQNGGGNPFEIRFPEGVSLDDNLIKGLTPGTSDLSHDFGPGLGAQMIARTPNMTTEDKFHFRDYKPGDIYIPLAPFASKTGVSQSLEAPPAFESGDVLAKTYPVSALAQDTLVDGTGERVLLLDSFAPTPERKQDALAGGSRYLDEDALANCLVEKCVIPFQMAYSGLETDADGNPVMTEDGFPSMRTMVSSDVIEVEVTSVIQQDRPSAVSEETAEVFTSNTWEGRVWYGPQAPPVGSFLNAANSVRPYETPALEKTLSFLSLYQATTIDGEYRFGFGVASRSNTGIDPDISYSVDVFSVDPDGNLTPSDGSITDGRFVIEVGHQVEGAASWTADLLASGETQRSIEMPNGSVVNLEITLASETSVIITGEISGGPESAYVEAQLVGLSDSEHDKVDRRAYELFGADFGGSQFGHSESVIPGYDLRNSEREIPEVPTPEVPTPEVPTPEVPTPEVPTPEVPTPEVPTPEVPTPEVPETETVVAEEVPELETAFGEEEGVTETGAEKPVGLIAGLLAMAVGVALLAQKLRRKISMN